MWENAYDNFQLVVRGDQLYGVSGIIDERPSMKLASLTGEELALIDMHRGQCTRPTGSADAIFFRAADGTVRLDSASSRPEWISPMRPNCHDGVTVANGLLYWWPSVCDCQLTLYGVTCLGPAGDFNFTAQAREADRLERASGASTEIAGFTESPNDWPTFRADSACSAATAARVPERSKLLWSHTPKEPSGLAGFPATPPVAAGGLAFVSGADGVVRALDAATGQVKWTAYTGGAVRVPPTIWKGRALVGSGDGWVYAFEAATGRLIWRFRAAPASRKIPVYGSLSSTWPVASGVLVEDGTAYFAAGIANYDGTYVYALDAATGRIRWQNNTSGHLDQQVLGWRKRCFTSGL
jgi:outer membrane protein assembly factor BamB